MIYRFSQDTCTESDTRCIRSCAHSAESYGDGGLPTDAKGVAARTKLLAYIQQTNSQSYIPRCLRTATAADTPARSLLATLKALNLDKVIPLGTADAGSAVTEELCAGADFVMANVHPWFGSVAVDEAAAWT